jgi:Alr-MurF fusion protein
MPSYKLEKIAEIISGQLIGKGEAEIRNLVTDSRNLFSPVDSLFFAIKGERHDGHNFVEELFRKKNLKNFVVDHFVNSWKDIDCNFIVVKNVLDALQKLSAHHREHFKGTIIGITGSNGKTIVKEWLYQLMHEDKVIIRSPKSFNSQVGVPLSVWNLESDAELAIFEAGISKPGEMGKLEKIIKPDIGIFTNIGEAHQENFSSLKEKIEQKLELFKNAEVIIYCKDHSLIAKEIEKSAHTNQVILDWSSHKKAALQITEITDNKNFTSISGNYLDCLVQIKIPFTDKASVENAINCWLLMLHLGYDNNIIENRMQKLQSVAMRLELKKGMNNCTIINDSYNSDIYSLNIALDFLNQQQQQSAKTLILSDILQTGKNETELYNAVSKLVENKKINRLIGIGPALFRNAGMFSCKKDFYLTTEDFLKQLHSGTFQNEAILIKGARNFGFEDISSVLEQKAHRTVLEINLSAMVHNLNYFKSKLKPATKIIAMVKAFSYGSGSYEIANTLEYQNVDYLAVAFADEGVALRQSGIGASIIVMNPEEAGFRAMIEYNLEPEIFSFDELDRFSSFLKLSQIEDFPVHIKLDSGMHRLGFVESEIPELCIELTKNKYINVRSVFSHLAASDEPQHDNFTLLQVSRFDSMSQHIINALGRKVDRHILNSMGIERFPDAQFEMVRLGIGLYGINEFNQAQLRNVSSLKTTILQVKTIAPGETVGYGRKGKVEKDKKIAILPIGYADGYSRKLGNGKGHVWINGHLAGIIGNICMDMCMVDLSGIDAKEGDDVEVFGEHITISELAQQMETIPYEVLTNISSRVKRIYIQE